ncbi:NAD(P)/FAD-dependent oxidoreductase [Halomonas sp. TRM85114]|uniref:NAD(P)/FAD-dependent oxidoreductase n=1 Tax=Halomonas jincaotanensis TaxID=2810616 RepID=UPI001BD5C895|nr:FAD-dependent oxidoreductase [Halomonas jincaotanensis]MBS9402973.1 NAD(P)/FAD-dependent oxidoreductase [Halomonas jincaotanensis]
MHHRLPRVAGAHEHLVIVGNGMAGHRLIEALRKRLDGPLPITVLGDERTAAYNRIMLSPLLAGEMDREGVALSDDEWYAEQGIELILGERVAKLDRQVKYLTTDTGRQLAFDRLILATGSRPSMPDIEGITLAGVHGFRDLKDAAALTAAAEKGGHAVVVGGGLLGLEAAEGLRKQAFRKQGSQQQNQDTQGLQVSVLQRAGRLMNRQLDATAASLLEAELVGRGLEVHTEARLAALEGDANGHVVAVRLEDGRRLPADCVVIAAGITPNDQLGRQAGLDVDRAIVVDDTLTTSDPAIHALGECCQFQSKTYGLVEPIWRQVEVLAEYLANKATGADSQARYVERPSATQLKISGISLYAFGPTEPDDDHDVLSYHDPAQGDYRRLLLRNGRLEGVVLYGDTAMGPWYFAQAQSGRDLSACRQALLLGSADADALLDAHDTRLDEHARPQKEAA